jgi:hypothetical protein
LGYRRGESVQCGGRHLDVHAGVGDALAVGQRRRVTRALAACYQEAFEHHAGHATLARGDLFGEGLRDRRLTAVVLAAVVMTRVHHDAPREAGRRDEVQCLGHVGGRVVRAAAAAAQDHVRVDVPARRHDRGRSGRRHAEERVPGRRGTAGVHRHLNVAVGPVLEPDRHRKTGGELPVHLALRRPGPDGAPGHGVGDVLRRDRVEPLAAHRHAQAQDVDQQPARDAQPAVHVVAVIHCRVVDEALPPGHRARLLEVDAHHNKQVTAVNFTQFNKAPGVFEGGLRIVDGARPGDHEQPIVGAAEQSADLGPGTFNRLRFLLREPKLLEQRGWRQQRLVRDDPGVPDA